MDVLGNLTEDMKNALRAGDKMRLLAVRYLMAQVKNAQIDKADHAPLTEDEFLKIIRNQVKSSEESIAQYREGNREDLAEEESAKVAIMKEYLPAQMSEEEVRALVAQLRADNPDVAQGPFIGLVMKNVGARSDGGTVNKMVRESFNA